MKESEWKILSELMRDSRRSDRDLAKAVRSSQPTVSRTRRRLEEEGYIREYTIIPEFSSLGFQLFAVTFIKMRKNLSQKEIEEAKAFSRTLAVESSKTGPFEVIMAERGIGMGFNGVFLSLHESYSSYVRLRDWLRKVDWLDPAEVQSFLIDLNDETRYLPLSFANLSTYLAKMGEREKKR